MVQVALFPDWVEITAPALSPAVEVYEKSQRCDQITRIVTTHTAERVSSTVESMSADDSDLHASYDAAWLRGLKAPTRPTSRGTIRLVDLFSGCGGLRSNRAPSIRHGGTSHAGLRVAF
jgi:hypothetical protein